MIERGDDVVRAWRCCSKEACWLPCVSRFMSLPTDNSPDSSAEEEAALAPPLPPPTFSMRTLMLGMAFIAVVLSAWRLAGPVPTLLFVLLALSIAAHVAANAIGTLLRNRADETDSPRDELVSRPSAATPRLEATNLAKREGLGWPSRISILLGAILGGAGGAALLLSTDTEKATWQDTLIGSLAFAALGGMGGFVFGSFLQVIYRAFRQANAGDLLADEPIAKSPDMANLNGNAKRNVAPDDSPSL